MLFQQLTFTFGLFFFFSWLYLRDTEDSARVDIFDWVVYIVECISFMGFMASALAWIWW